MKKLITLETKKEIINKRENGKALRTLIRVEDSMAKSTICTILKTNEELKLRRWLGDSLGREWCDLGEIEILLILWIKEK